MVAETSRATDAPIGIVLCPVCARACARSFLPHLREEHRPVWRQWVDDFARRCAEGWPLERIGEHYGISWVVVEKALRARGLFRNRRKPIKYLQPPGEFLMEVTTLWTFPRRGDWATHSPDYRGNWAPEIARNLIERYSAPGELVLDCFVGGGTTAIEAKLLQRRFIGRDINPGAIQATIEALDFEPEGPFFEPDIAVGDATRLRDIPDESIDLIATHPPYANIIAYSDGLEGDLSLLKMEDFLERMVEVADECLRVLRPGKFCAILVGDTRRNKNIVPLGFEVMNRYLQRGFVLKDTIIKAQHNMKMTGFWYKKSIEHNFLLLAHEYIFIFRKPLPPAGLQGRLL
jgi:SAM-dependent methyltransferase